MSDLFFAAYRVYALCCMLAAFPLVTFFQERHARPMFKFLSKKSGRQLWEISKRGEEFYKAMMTYAILAMPFPNVYLTVNK